MVEGETTGHTFAGCEWAKRAWFSSSLGLRVPQVAYVNFSQSLQYLLLGLLCVPEEGASLAAGVMLVVMEEHKQVSI